MLIYHPFIPKFLWLRLASRAVSEVRTVCILPTAWSSGGKRALNNMIFRFPYWRMLFPSALLLLELFCLPGINRNWEKSLAHLVASVPGQSMSSGAVVRRRITRSVTVQLLRAGPGGVKIRISAWTSLWISLCVLCCWRGYIKYGHWAIPKGRLQKENSTSVSFFPGLLAEAVWEVWLQPPNYPWHCLRVILNEQAVCPNPFPGWL